MAYTKGGGGGGEGGGGRPAWRVAEEACIEVCVLVGVGKILEGKILEGKILEGKILEGKILEGKILEGNWAVGKGPAFTASALSGGQHSRVGKHTAAQGGPIRVDGPRVRYRAAALSGLSLSLSHLASAPAVFNLGIGQRPFLDRLHKWCNKVR